MCVCVGGGGYCVGGGLEVQYRLRYVGTQSDPGDGEVSVSVYVCVSMLPMCWFMDLGVVFLVVGLIRY